MGKPIERDYNKGYRKLLELTLDELPPEYRSVYIMREIEQLPAGEAAECLGIPAGEVHERLLRAKKKVQESLEKQVKNKELFSFLGDRCDSLVGRVMQRIDHRP